MSVWARACPEVAHGREYFARWFLRRRTYRLSPGMCTAAALGVRADPYCGRRPGRPRSSSAVRVRTGRLSHREVSIPRAAVAPPRVWRLLDALCGALRQVAVVLELRSDGSGDWLPGAGGAASSSPPAGASVHPGLVCAKAQRQLRSSNWPCASQALPLSVPGDSESRGLAGLCGDGCHEVHHGLASEANHVFCGGGATGAFATTTLPTVTSGCRQRSICGIWLQAASDVFA